MHEKLKNLRLKKGITQEEMAIKLGYKYASGYNQLENGKRKINIEIARKISLILEEPVEVIFFDNKAADQPIVLLNDVKNNDTNKLIDSVQIKNNEKYYEMVVLKEVIEETRGELNDLVAVKQNHLSEDVLSLSRKLDNLIYRYMTLQTNLKSKA
ncbi:XRE family transcriptional regulator [Geosporobacter ferrireducens]|uniref:HTH cro/C1-type domain-containing protein n=1 Tax=Geosporobacter ferrireducens TaxID=1424294 RepID=A0A1D8GKW1_9FIRM|nr:XRE family transcriptional regulator [Geosporobacter ferrireducens]AOT71545.1 hypothetical protein Gferi_19610 [Geosporobacter ferrireducens]